MKLTSQFAMLDVMRGRKALAKRLLTDKGRSEGVPVVIRGRITGIWGNDDGVSREFEVEVKSVEEDAL